VFVPLFLSLGIYENLNKFKCKSLIFVRFEVITFYFDNFLEQRFSVLKDTWVEAVEEQRVMIYAFGKTGISLKVDGSEDVEKMKFHGQEIGISPGLEI